MRIGIITLPLQYNYGGILQAYALQTILERMGHEVRVIRLNQIKPIPSKAWLRYTKRFIIKVMHAGKGRVLAEKKHNEEFPILTARTWSFVENYIHSFVIDDYSEIHENMFDAFVVGSDQVWRSGYTPSVLPFFLNFAEEWNVRRVAYAASFGLDTWPISSTETAECIRLIGKFDAVSVRELSGVQLCKEIMKVDASYVLDPTLLLSRDEYVDIIEASYNERCFTTYTLDENPEKIKIIDHIRHEKQLPQNKIFTKEHNLIQPLSSIEEWLNSFRKSEFVFTDSFHGTVFSIIFNKQFVVFANTHRGTSRMESLLGSLNLQNRLVHSYDDYMKIKDEWIDYEMVNEKLNTLRETSFDFLRNSVV